MPKVSVLVPIFNMQKYLRQSINSITGQTLEDIQIICIDDGSTDGSLELLEEFAKRDSRIEIISKPNSGYGNSMNLGLDAARGEYIGIVEPDDFIDLEMFETLYALAKKHDADVVRSNYYRHVPHTDPSDDFVVEYLEGCEYDQVFRPRDTISIFVTEPSTCTSVYRRSLIEGNGIRYLESPGASFQDTYFNYQIIALAERMYLTKEAFHHYRINEGSSVLSPGKLFCVCDEYDAIWNHAKNHPDIFDALKYRIPRAQLGTYIWNLERLSPSVQYDFFLRFAETFQDFSEKGLLKRDYFDDFAWDFVQEMLANPRRFYAEHYGPVEIDDSVLILVSSQAEPALKKVSLLLKDVYQENSEIYFLPDGTLESLKGGGADVSQLDPRYHMGEYLVDAKPVMQVSLEGLRGRNLSILHLREKISSNRELQKLADKIKECREKTAVHADEKMAVGFWDLEELRSTNLPIWEALLFCGFYSSAIPERPADLPEWMIEKDAKERCAQLEEVRCTNASFGALYEYASEQLGADDYERAKTYHKFFSRLWIKVQGAYDDLGYDDRLQFGERPSPLQFPPLIYKLRTKRAEDASPLTVVIPVYNVERFLPDCLNSVLAQDLDDLQIVCVNDATPDSSLEILEAYADEFDNLSVVSQFNGGAGAARNRGIELSDGEYLAFLDVDDFFSGDDALRKMLSAAKEHGALVCGGSLEFFKPDGSVEPFNGGERFYYNIKESGFKSFTQMETDYAAGRFIYHRSIFTSGGVRFPEFRWYEDPVFLTRVIDFTDDFYGLSDLVYEYRAEYKECRWSLPQVRDMVKGISLNLEFARKHSLSFLYSSLITRIERDYYKGIMEYIDDEEVFTSLAYIQGNLDHSLLNVVKENGWKTYLIKPFYDLIMTPDTAIVRAAKRAQDTVWYHALQSMRSRFD